MSRPELKGKIQTVLGPIEPEKLGRTLMHEHLLCDIRPPDTRSDNDLGPEITLENVWAINYGAVKRAARKYVLDLEDIAVREVAMRKHEGGDTVVELSCGGLSPDPNGTRRIAAGTGVHLSWAAATTSTTTRIRPTTIARSRISPRDDRPGARRRLGHRCARRHDRRDRLPDAVDRHREARDAGRGHRRTARPAPRSTSIPAAIPTSRRRSPTSPRRRGLPTERIVISHIDRTVFDEPRLLRLADTGVMVEFDLFGQESSYYG